MKKKQQQVTIKDIATEVGMSVSSVSRALSDHKHISEETKAKVTAAAKRLGYRYNALAAALRSSRSKTIGLIVPRISMPFQAAVITAIQNRLQTYGYNLMIFQSNESPEQEKKIVNLLMGTQVEGLIVSVTLYTKDYHIFDRSTLGNVPVVFYDRVPIDKACHKIVGDEFNGGYQVTKHLLAQGCRQIAHISGPLSCSIYLQRLSGYKEALSEFNIPYNEDLVFFHELNKENTLKSCETLFSREIVPDAIFACNDTAALAVLEFARNMKITVPGNLKVSGYANDSRTEISRPEITSVEQFPHLMGDGAAKLIMDLIESADNNKSFTSLTTPIELITRTSTNKD
jgi:DNA-binding LacI/PurR family transcriptional regulator